MSARQESHADPVRLVRGRPSRRGRARSKIAPATSKAMLLPTIIFALFALASAAGAYLLFAHQRGRGMGLAAATAVLAFFAALFWVVVHLVMSAGMAGPGTP